MVLDLARCQEDVKPLRDLALCLLKKRGWKMNCFGFDLFLIWWTWVRKKGGFSSFLFAGRDETLKPPFSDMFHVCHYWKEWFVLFGFLAHFVDINRSFLVVSDLYRCQEDVKPLRDLALCMLNEREWLMFVFFFFWVFCFICMFVTIWKSYSCLFSLF